MKRSLILISAAFLSFYGCEKTLPSAPAEHDLLDGPISGLTPAENAQFLAGDEGFSEVFTIERGLGPVFVASNCASCHPGDGKGTPFVQFTRFGQGDTNGNQFLSQGGPQLQHKAIPGYQPETLPPGAPSANFIAPSVTGLGFLDAVDDSTFLAFEDPNDLDGDGISGRAHFIDLPEYVRVREGSVQRNGRYMGRFGKKAGAHDLLHQTAMAYNQDMGITSIFESIDPYSGLEEDPEVSTQTVNQVVFYLKTLKTPIQRNSNEVEIGKNIFNNIGCGSCHIPNLRTGSSPIAALNFKDFQPYTDLLLHDMGPELDDGYTEGYALSSEWRTPPLWGLGLSKDAQGGRYFLMHDGRAASIEEAILLHGGEGATSRSNYLGLSENNKEDLIKFLESL